MYPDWPNSAADLVPLPRSDGPKLKPFDFQGRQQIRFLEYLGEGLHSHVLKVEIKGQTYALKLFRFVYDDDWLGPSDDKDSQNLEAMSAFYDYSEPFSCECRAFGRLQETGYETIAVKCFGYLLLDEAHERALTDQFHLEFNGNIELPGADDLRSRFLGAASGRPPPIRGILKEFGQANQDLRTRHARTILRNIVRMQQLGIINVEVRHDQIVSGKLADLSKAITTPHYMTTPELNPRLTPEWISAMEFETFQFSAADFWYFDEMVAIWNEEHPDKRAVSVYAFPCGPGRAKYALRNTPRRERIYSLVDPRLYDWTSSARAGRRESGTKAKRGVQGPSKGVSKKRRRLPAVPPIWFYDCGPAVAARLKEKTIATTLEWVYRNGLIFPRRAITSP